MAVPDFLICLECETPNYVFEWKGGKLVEILCLACGNDDTDTFATQEEMEQLYAADR